MENSPAEVAYTILESVIYPTIATTDNLGMPWAAPQFTVYDRESKAFYWCAYKNSQHGLNIASNPKVYIVAYDSMAAPGQGQGVYAQAIAEPVTKKVERKHVFAALRKRHGDTPYWDIADIEKENAQVTLFKATVQQAWINQGREQNGTFVLYRERIEL